MGRPFDFDRLWVDHQHNRSTFAGINPDGNRCAVIVGATLSLAFKPRDGEMSFRDIEAPPLGIRGQPFLAKFYVKAEQLAKRIQEEWGPPDYKIVGSKAAETINGKKGIVFVENAWRAGWNIEKTVDHIDLWDGKKMGAYDEEKSRVYMARADFVWLWLIPLGQSSV